MIGQFKIRLRVFAVFVRLMVAVMLCLGASGAAFAEEAAFAQAKEERPFNKVTVAAIITPQQADGTAWDIGAGADLILCGAAGCYVSNGLEQEATFYAGSGALRLIKKAGACRDVVKCLFRGVDLSKLQTETKTAVQLVDVDYVSHQYLEDVAITKADQCQVSEVIVDCVGGIHRRTFSLWVIDEAVAQRAGKGGMDYVLYKGLDQQRFKALSENVGELRKRLKLAVGPFYQKLSGETVSAVCLERADFLAETFYVMGLADANGRRAELLLKDLVGHLPLDRVAGLIRRTPAFYWAFLDIAQQLEDFSSADEYLYKNDQKGLLLAKLDAKEAATSRTQLIYGWQVKGRAKAALDGCALASNTKTAR